MDKKSAQEIALFRYGLVAPVIHDENKVKLKYFKEVSAKQYTVPGSGIKKSYSISTLKNWLNLYKNGGVDALYPSTRSDAGSSKKISEDLYLKLVKIIEDYPYLSASGIYRMLITEGTISGNDFSVVTLRNYIRNQSLRITDPSKTPRKKFEMPAVNMLWIADFMHGPYLRDSSDHNRKKKTYLCAIIDDHSRLIIGSKFFFRENTLSLASVFKEAILQYGLPQKFYCDNGAVFSTAYLSLACARCKISLIHSKPYDSPSRGKIERFFRTVRGSFLAAQKSPLSYSIEDLNDHWYRWLQNDYNESTHSSTKETPLNRYLKSLSHSKINRIPEHELDKAFYISFERVVKKDATISLNGLSYEVPPEYIGCKIELRAPLDKPTQFSIFEYEQPMYSVKQVNLAENAQKPYTFIHFSKHQEGDNL